MTRRNSSTSAKPHLSKGIFTGSTFGFLNELRSNNDRDWFASNKFRYESDVLHPALEFVQQMKPRLSRHSRYLSAVAKRVGGSIMRIYRDTRFSKDKTPYKTNLGIHFRHSLGGDVHAPGLYVHIEPGACFLAAGIWMPPAEPLQMIRQSILESPTEWKRTKNNKNFRSHFQLEGESLKTAPRGIPKDHPEIADLRRKSFAGMMYITDEQVTDTSFVEFADRALLTARPLMKFLCDALHQPY
jgi:uncharacterized protein (TIGR02453 family)